MILIVIAVALGGLVYLKWKNGQTPAPPVAPPASTQPFFAPAPQSPAPSPASSVDLLSLGMAYQSQREAEAKQEALKGFLDAVVGFAKGPTGPKSPAGTP